MSNPFNNALDWALQGKRVRVYTDHGVLSGWVDRIHHNRGSLVLHDCYDEDRDLGIGSAFVRTANRVDVLKPRKQIKFRALDELQAHPAHPEDFEPRDAVVRRCYRNQFAGGYPVVREDGTILNGHKRIAAARLAGMDKHPVEVVDVTDDQADELFAIAHRDEDFEPEVASDKEAEDGQHDPVDDEEHDAGDAVMEPMTEAEKEFRERMDAATEDSDAEKDDIYADEIAPTATESDGNQDDSVDEPASEPAPVDEKLGTFEAKSYGMVFSGEVHEFFAGDADRVTVHQQDGRYELAPGESDEWPDYSVSSNAVQIGSPGVDALNAEPGDAFVANADGEVVVLEPVDETHPPADGHGDEEADADAESTDDGPAWCGVCGQGPFQTGEHVRDHHDRRGHPGEPVVRDEDPAEQLDAGDGSVEESRADGGAVAVATPSTDAGAAASATCQNCGSQVTANYARVFAPDEEEGPRVCPDCEDKIREGDGTVREKRSTAGGDGS